MILAIEEPSWQTCKESTKTVILVINDRRDGKYMGDQEEDAPDSAPERPGGLQGAEGSMPWGREVSGRQQAYSSPGRGKSRCKGMEVNKGMACLENQEPGA